MQISKTRVNADLTHVCQAQNQIHTGDASPPPLTNPPPPSPGPHTSSLGGKRRPVVMHQRGISLEILCQPLLHTNRNLSVSGYLHLNEILLKGVGRGGGCVARPHPRRFVSENTQSHIPFWYSHIAPICLILSDLYVAWTSKFIAIVFFIFFISGVKYTQM